jgi:hypothetical protein
MNSDKQTFEKLIGRLDKMDQVKDEKSKGVRYLDDKALYDK